MEQEEDTLSMPPFWAPNGEFGHRNRRRLRRSYSLLVTSTSLLVLFLVIVLVFAFIVVPTLHSFASNILRPHTVKNSWDSLNLVLVLFAIVCGFLSRNNTNTETETETPCSHYQDHRRFSDPSTPPPWYQYSHYSDTDRSLNRLRSFNSYPDLRQHVAADERLRFYDDTHLLHRHCQPRPQDEHEEEMSIQNVAPAPPRTQAVRINIKRGYQADTIEEQETNDLIADISQPPPQSLPSPPPVPSPVTRTKAVRRNAQRTYQVEAIEKSETNDLVAENSQPPQSPPSPPPQSRMKAVRRNAKRTYQKEPIEKKAERNDLVVKSSEPPPPPPLTAEGKMVHGVKKRGVATKEFLSQLTGKKKQRQRSVENFDSILNSEPLASQPPPPGPSPPPSPPPPHSAFQNLFSSNKGKQKKRHFVSVATTTTRVSNKREQSSYSLEENNVMIIGNESPLIPIPPPPPPPPFKLPAWKFRVQGDFVRVDSIGSSRSGSPDLDEVNVDSPTISTQDETSQCNSPFAPDDEDTATVTAASLFCPSPDVDTKAHNFIQTFRAGLRMAKMNSMKEKQGIGRSNLGPSPNSQTINGTRPS